MFLLSSCSIQKRRYSRGWAVDFTLFRNPLKDKQSNKSNKRVTAAAIQTPDHFAAPSTMRNEPKHKIGSAPIVYNIISDSNTKSVHKHPDKPTMQKDHPSIQHPQKKNQPKRNIALIIGASLLLMAIVAAICVPIISGMFVLGNPALTATQVTANFGQYTIGVIGWIVVLILDVLVSIGVYKYYKNERPKMSLTSGVLRFIYSAFLGVAILQLLKVTVSSPALSIYNHINTFNSIWSWGLIVFGLHLISLGILYTNEGGKKWLNILIKALLITAGIGYIVINLGMLFAPNPVAYAAIIQPIFLVPMILGEIFFAIWMLVKGGKK